MYPVQVAVLVAPAGGTIVYTGYRFWRDARAEREFFRALVEELSSVVLPKGFRLTHTADFSRMFPGHATAWFEGPAYSLEVFWDYVDREVILSERDADRARSGRRVQIAAASIPRFGNLDAFRKATAAIVEGAARSDGAIFSTPAQFLVEDTFTIASRGLFVAHGKILSGTVRRGQSVTAPPGLTVPVDALEFVLLSATEGRENVALCFRYRDEEELARWRRLSLAGQTLELTDAVEGEHHDPIPDAGAIA